MKNKAKEIAGQRSACAVKKALSLLLAITMLFTVIAEINLSAYAANGVYQKLNSLKTSYPSGRYWNHYVSDYSECVDNLNQYDNKFSKNTTTHPCTGHGIHNTVGLYDCNAFHNGQQCWGFANRIFYDVFGQQATNLAKRYDTGNVTVGDWVRLINDSHSAVVIGKSGSTITVVECNNGGTCKINWGTSYSTSQITYFYHASNYDNINNQYNTEEVITFSSLSAKNITTNSVTIEFYTANPNFNVTKIGLRIKKTGESSWGKTYEENIPASIYANNNPLHTSYVVGSGKEINYALAQGTSYTWQAYAVANGKTYSSSNNTFKTSGISRLQTPLPKLTVNLDGTFTISWDAIAGADMYQIKETNGKEYYTILGPEAMENPSIKTSSHQYGKSFSYQVRALNTNNDYITSNFSASVTGINNKRLLIPTMTLDVNTDASFTLSWNEIAGADKYEVYLKSTDDSYRLLRTVSTNTTTIGGAVYGKEYTYKVRAVNNSNSSLTSEYSSAVSGVNDKKLIAPTAKAVVNTNGGFTISWNAVSGADKYDVYIDNGTGYKLLRTVTGTSTTTGTAHYGKEYSYKVRAVNSKNSAITSAFSSAVSAINNKRLVTPTAKAIVNANGGFTISWNTVVGADKYDVYIDNGTGYKLLRTVTGTSTTTGTAHYGKKYSYKVRAVNSKNSAITSAFSSAVTATNNVRLVTPVPKIKVNANASFTLSWNPVIGADTYEIYLKTANGSYRLLKTVNTNSATIGGAVKGKTYTYKVRAINSKNNAVTSAFSSELSGIY